jgi:hypothetical protein
MKASALFLRTAVVAVLIGSCLGLAMGVTHDFTLTAVHAHVNLVGWASMFLFGLYYRLTPAADNRYGRCISFRQFAACRPRLARGRSLHDGLPGDLRLERFCPYGIHPGCQCRTERSPASGCRLKVAAEGFLEAPESC